MCSRNTLEKEWLKIFSKIPAHIAQGILVVVLSIAKAGSLNTAKIALHMQDFTGLNFNSNDVKLRRLLSAPLFQVDDKIWRCYFKMLFGILLEKKLFSKDALCAINVDFTSINDKFLLLFASIPFMGRGIPLYFSIRNYPRKTGQYDHKKMEKAFMKELWKLLPKNGNYVIVADRGFGNVRFMQICQELGFHYLVRANDSWKVTDGNSEELLIREKNKQNHDWQEVTLSKTQFQTRLISSFAGASEGWHLFTSLNQRGFQEIVKIYSHRFQIEKMFQDLKSAGFDIEKSKIQKYSTFKRLLFLGVISQMLMMFAGDWLVNDEQEVKKNFPLHINVILASSNLLSEQLLFASKSF